MIVRCKFRQVYEVITFFKLPKKMPFFIANQYDSLHFYNIKINKWVVSANHSAAVTDHDPPFTPFTLWFLTCVWNCCCIL